MCAGRYATNQEAELSRPLLTQPVSLTVSDSHCQTACVVLTILPIALRHI